METVRINMKSILPVAVNVVKPQLTTSSLEGCFDNELEYHLVKTDDIKETTCYDRLTL